MADKPAGNESRVPIDPQAAINAVSAENEWRRNRNLLLENEVVRQSRRIAELEQRCAELEVALKDAARPAAKTKEAK